MSDGNWWDGAAFGKAPPVTPADFFQTSLNGSNWTYNNNNLSASVSGNLITGTSYYITSYAFDDAGSQEAPYAAAQSSTFTFDIDLPTAAVQYPANTGVYKLASLTTLSGTFQDTTSPVVGVQMSLKRLWPWPAPHRRWAAAR